MYFTIFVISKILMRSEQNTERSEKPYVP